MTNNEQTQQAVDEINKQIDDIILKAMDQFAQRHNEVEGDYKYMIDYNANEFLTKVIPSEFNYQKYWDYYQEKRRQ